MKEYELKYGCNPNQKPAKIYMEGGGELPIEILGGRPGYINFLDALNGWQLVRELKAALKLPAAASFKHVSPTSAALGLPLSEALKRASFVDDIEGLDASPLACAYARARGTDRLSSFGDWIALSEPCDEVTARIIRREVSDGFIAPGYTEKALEILKRKKNGGYNIVRIDPDYVPDETEKKQVFGVTFLQGRNNVEIGPELLKNIVTKNGSLPEEAVRDLIVSLITLKYTQSNSVCYAYGGQAIGVGAGQQSRIHCTRLAGDKADKWLLRQSELLLDLPFPKDMGRAERDNAIDVYIDGMPRELKRAYLDKITGVALGSDAFFPFPDNIERARLSGVSYVAEPGGSARDGEVIEACDRHGMVMAFTGVRLFHH
jgi:AICAR transformylase/IMP cyclohydrolase PurH